MDFCRCIQVQGKLTHRCDCEFEAPFSKYKSDETVVSLDSPVTPQGQMVGAILRVKHLHIASNWLWLMKVGDCVEILEHHPNGFCTVESIRTGEIPMVKWESFLE